MSDHLADPTGLAFREAIDANPRQWLTYMVYADWLDEQEAHDLAEGYRAIGRLRRRPKWEVVNGDAERPWLWRASGDRCEGHWELPQAWSLAIGKFHIHKSHEAALDTAALAYARLTPEQKVEIERQLAPAGD